MPKELGKEDKKTFPLARHIKLSHTYEPMCDLWIIESNSKNQMVNCYSKNNTTHRIQNRRMNSSCPETEDWWAKKIRKQAIRKVTLLRMLELTNCLLGDVQYTKSIIKNDITHKNLVESRNPTLVVPKMKIGETRQ